MCCFKSQYIFSSSLFFYHDSFSDYITYPQIKNKQTKNLKQQIFIITASKESGIYEKLSETALSQNPSLSFSLAGGWGTVLLQSSQDSIWQKDFLPKSDMKLLTGHISTMAVGWIFQFLIMWVAHNKESYFLQSKNYKSKSVCGVGWLGSRQKL